MEAMHRRKRWLPVSVAVVAAACAPVERDASWPVLGSHVEARVFAANAHDLDTIFAEIEQTLERGRGLLDSSDPQSAVAAVNAGGADAAIPIPERELWLCLRLALDWAEASDGAYDPTIGPLESLFRLEAGRLPSRAELAGTRDRIGWERIVTYPEARAVRFLRPGMRLELGEVARGFVLDMAKRALALPGARAGLLRSGPTVYAWRRPPGAESWIVPLVEPTDTTDRYGSILLRGRGLSIAGSLRGIVDPAWEPPIVADARSGGPARTDVLAAVAVADSAADAAAIARALLVLGSQRAARLLERSRRVEALLLVRGASGNQLLASSSLVGRVEIAARLRDALTAEPRYLLPPADLEATSSLR